GAVAGAAAGSVSYANNELRVVHEVTLDHAWDAANATVKELQFPVMTSETHKDATRGVLRARNAEDQPIFIQLFRKGDKLTEIRIRVGTLDTAANRTTAQLIYDKMKARM